MDFRICYVDGPGHRPLETVVQANNTTEAVVKFCHTNGGGQAGRVRDRITSIYPEEPQEPMDGGQ